MSDLGSNPLVFDYILTPQVTIRTSVTGNARNIATVSILSATVAVWAASLTQAAPKATTPKLVMGDFTIEEGASFTLTVPSTIQDGNVFFKGKIQSGSNDPVEFSAIVASWALSSTQQAQRFIDSQEARVQAQGFLDAQNAC
jgi:hypothetical protein